MTRSDPATLTLPEFDQDRAEAAVRELLIAIGEDPERQGLIDTPSRVARAYRAMCSAISRFVSAARACAKSTPARDPNIAALERELAEKLATRVSLAHSRSGGGKVVIHYHSLDELDGILERLR